MLEVKITITATEIAAAINNLAAALGGKNPHTVCNQYGNEPPTTGPATPITPMVPVAPPAVPAKPVAESVPAPVPTAPPQYTLDMLASAGSALIDAGKMDQLLNLLGKFGVASLTELAPGSYGIVANELRALGAAI